MIDGSEPSPGSRLSLEPLPANQLDDRVGQGRRDEESVDHPVRITNRSRVSNGVNIAERRIVRRSLTHGQSIELPTTDVGRLNNSLGFAPAKGDVFEGANGPRIRGVER
jgi:hypothetical protein